MDLSDATPGAESGKNEPAPATSTAPRATAVPAYPRAKGPWLQLFNPLGFEWNEVILPIRQLPFALIGLRILHVTDLHLRKGWMSALDRLLAEIRRDPPDILVCTGDFVENKHNHHPALPNVKRLVAGFRAHLGSFAVMGNHDGRLADDLYAPNLQLLDRQRVLLPCRGERIELIGLPRLAPGIGPDQPFIDSLPAREPGVPRIMLSHFSDLLPRTYAAAPDLFLAGHTHGGQVCLPGGWPILKHTSLRRRYCSGFHRFGPTWLVANRGIGFSSLPIRLFCPGEVVDIRLAREE